MATRVNEWNDVLDAIADTGYESDNRFKHGVFQAERESLEPDLVNSPPHYAADDAIECIDAIQAALGDGFKYYLQGNCLKYLWRFNLKGKPEQDLLKLQWYLNRLIEEVRG